MSYESAAAAVLTETKVCVRCAGEMVKLEIGTRLSVHMPGTTPEAYWTATPLDSWTCTDCGKTDLFARNPKIFRT